MQQPCSPREGERLQRAVLAMALELYPHHLTRRQMDADLGDTPEVHAAVRFLVRSRLLRWEDEAVALTVPAIVFDRLAL